MNTLKQFNAGTTSLFKKSSSDDIFVYSLVGTKVGAKMNI